MGQSRSMIISRIAALCVVAVALVGCSTTVTGSPAAEGAAPAAAGSDGAGAPVDACKLLEPAEVQQLIGANDGGMRSLSGGQVQFVAGTRDCAVQVVTDPFSKDDEQKAVALAKVVQSRL